MNTDNSVGIAGGGRERAKGDKWRTETWQYTENVLRNCAPETCRVLLTKERILMLLNLNSHRLIDIYSLFCVSNGHGAQHFRVGLGNFMHPATSIEDNTQAGKGHVSS